ncbi:MAG: DNA polymerase I [Burkholderiales bacterium]|nr:DNA polymerase I [Burkholderiales bacterium]
MPRLLLVDGSSYLYRAFHALPDLRSPAGFPTGAMHGMVSMLKKLAADHPADLRACVFDAKGKTFRDAMYPAYKAQRAPMPDDLVRQIEPIHELVRALGWPLLMVEGVEADDVIATLASAARAEGIETVISTGDKDLAQLVEPGVTLINTMSNERLDPEAVIAKFGVPPERIVDFLALTGDAVDNVPGVDKVGPKTAAKWIAEYGSLDGVISHAAEVKGVLGENLRRALDWLPTGRALVTVKRDVAGLQLGALRPQDADQARLRDLFASYGFRTWLREMEAAATTPAPDAPAVPTVGPTSPGAPDTPREYECVRTETQLRDWIARLEAAPLAALDTETTGLDPMRARLVGISFAVEPFRAAYVPLAHAGPDGGPQVGVDRCLALLRGWLESPRHAKVGQNLKYDAHIFANHGIRLDGIAHDTLLQSYVIESHRSHDMDSLAERHLGRRTIKYEDVAGKGAGQIGFDQVPIDKATDYAAEDAEVTLHLHQTLWPQIEADARLRFIYELELPVARVLMAMERTGVLIDASLLEKQSSELGAAMIDLERRAYEIAGQPFNLGSPKQIGEIFFERMGLPVVKKTPSGAPSTDEEVLQKLAEDYPLPRVLLDYRGLSKLKSTYTDKLPRMVNPATGRVHTNYAQAVAVTGRLASNDPNLQNIPIRTPEGRRIREAFIAPPGSLIMSADYSQIELRIMAHISRDPALLAAFAAGEDVHRATAAEIFGIARDAVSAEQRRYAKVINFGLIYGMSAFGLAANLGIERDAASNYIDRYFDRFAGVKRYMDETRLAAKARGYVETVFGRRLWLPEINSPNGPRRQGAERAAINAPMQGTAADLIKMSMVAVQQAIEAEGLNSRLVMQVHDELVLEVPERELAHMREAVPRLMSAVASLDVPLVAEVGVGPNWDRAH